MSRSRNPYDDSQQEMDDLENFIFAARNYVVPSDDLRPRTLEDARDLGLQRREIRRLGFASVIGIALWGLSLAFVNSANAYREAWVTPSGEDLQRIAYEISDRTNDNREWGLVKVFERLRTLRVHDLGSISVQEFESN